MKKISFYLASVMLSVFFIGCNNSNAKDVNSTVTKIDKTESISGVEEIRIESGASEINLYAYDGSEVKVKGELGDYIIAADDVFDYPKLSVDSEYNKLLYNGNKLPVDAVREIERTPTQQAEQKYRIYDENCIFIGIYEYIDSMLVPEKIFYSGEHDEM